MYIKRAGLQPSAKGPADWFTGTVRIDPLFEAPNPARVRGASVTFEPGARTAWQSSAACTTSTREGGRMRLASSFCGRQVCNAPGYSRQPDTRLFWRKRNFPFKPRG